MSMKASGILFLRDVGKQIFFLGSSFLSIIKGAKIFQRVFFSIDAFY